MFHFSGAAADIQRLVLRVVAIAGVITVALGSAGCWTADAQSVGIADLEFGKLFRYEIGSALGAVHDHAAARGDRLRCSDIDLPELPDQSVCSVVYAGNGRSPESMLDVIRLMAAPPLPPYSLFFRGDTLRFFTVNIWPATPTARAELFAHLDSIGIRAFEGREARTPSSELYAWTGRDGPDMANVECRPIADADICTVRIRRYQSAEVVERALQGLRVMAPLPIEEQ